ncbi:hypothetical protein F3N42_03105 [Marinihelvus fidelis]|uniref:Class I SAM-dependent methyltransferase n=1 Tax=Marinihelvus fidelis TaxID=2613842 RepID=A0A5N0TE30_9GAMM|nr:hypothetical protein [Marinihelvus fidelis]KAA9133353.1 hypothetical protein F3N42_03105 [Marinihelvus fidelis]
MSEVLNPAGGVAAAGGTLPRQQSLLFPAVFEKLRKGDRFSVLDIGPATPETLRFYSAYRCHLHFASLFSESLVREGAGEMSHEETVKSFSDALAISDPGRRFDLVMFWDFPNYLPDTALRAFSDALSPYLHEKTLGHGFAVRASGTRLSNRWYGIDQPHLFTVRPPRDPQPKLYPHAQAILINLLTCFSVERGMLLPDGRLEVAMNANID